MKFQQLRMYIFKYWFRLVCINLIFRDINGIMRNQKHILFVPPVYFCVIPKSSSENIIKHKISFAKFFYPVIKWLFVDMILASLVYYCGRKNDYISEVCQVVDEIICNIT